MVMRSATGEDSPFSACCSSLIGDIAPRFWRYRQCRPRSPSAARQNRPPSPLATDVVTSSAAIAEGHALKKTLSSVAEALAFCTNEALA
jgi:hypothetical protein